ncbi:MAG: DUF2752 domain-containing protein [Fimbriimonadaceae bacterium]
MASPRVRASRKPFVTATRVTRWQDLGGEIFTFGVWLAMTVIGVLLRPSAEGFGTHRQLGLPPCGSIVMFGRPCPTCGMTTSISSLLKFDLTASLSAHPMGWMIYIGLTVFAIGSLYGIITRQRIVMNPFWLNTMLISFVIALMVYGVIRFFTTEPVNQTGLTPWG